MIVRAALLLLLATTMATPGAAAAPSGLPLVPDQDPFYAVPADVAASANGAVLDSRPVVATVLNVPMAADAWQVKYKTIDQHGAPSAFVTTVLLPRSAWHGAGERPLLSYQTAEDGVGTRCAPSYALRAGVAAGGGNGAEAALIALAVARGFAVSVPDYEGPRSEFGGAQGAAHGVLDGIRAAKNFAPAGISQAAPIGVMGYSGGALASEMAVQAQPVYAPELKLAGAALGGIPADLKATFLQFDASPVGGAIAIVLAGLDRAYPNANVLGYLNANGRKAIAASHTDCLLDSVARHPFATVRAWPIGWGVRPGVIDDPGFSKVFADASPLTQTGTPATPMLFYHSLLDELAPIGKMRELADRLCAKGVTVQKTESLAGEHAVYAIAGVPTALDYLADRFAGRPAPSTCR